MLHLTEELDSDGDRDEFIYNDDDDSVIASKRNKSKNSRNDGSELEYVDMNGESHQPSIPTATFRPSKVSPRPQQGLRISREGDFVLGYGGPRDLLPNQKPSSEFEHLKYSGKNTKNKNIKQGWMEEKKEEGKEGDEKRLFW